MKYRRLLTLGLLTLSVTGCVTYEKQPLVPEEIIREVEHIRSESVVSEADGLTFQKASELMSQKSPLLEKIRAKYKTVQSVADIKTPWFNPSIEVGPDLGSGLEPGVTGKTRPFIGLGFTIPLGGKLTKKDDLNKAKALRSFIEVQAKHREYYLNLRENYTNLYLTYRKQEVQQQLVDASKTMLKLTKTLMDAGSTTALDVGMVELDSNKAELDLMEMKSEIEELRSEMSVLLGVDATKFKSISKSSLPVLENKMPQYEDLKKLLLKNHLELARLRYDYEVAEKNLRLEISKQYPDIQFGAEREKEIGEDTVILGLRLGIDIPIFDRNQQGIALAKNEREEVRKEYIAEVHKALSELKKSFQNIKINQQRRKILVDVIQPRAEGNLKIAKQALQSGGIDALKYLDTLRAYQETMKDVALIEADVRVAWINLEKVLGFPLIKYPGEKEFAITLEPSEESTAKENTNE